MTAELRFPRSDSEQSAIALPVATSSAVARWCVSRGWPVHPLAPGRKTPVANCGACSEPGHRRETCACLSSGRWCHGFHAASHDLSFISEWWGSHPRHGVGVACGPARLVIIDIDDHPQPLPPRDHLLPGIPIPEQVSLAGLSNGFHTLGVLAALRGQVSPADDDATLRVRTPSGGLHVWYRVDDGRQWQCSVGSGGGRSLCWQVDVRAHGGYIVAPGTVTSAGTYTPVGECREPARLPSWLAQELERTGHLRPLKASVPRPGPSRARRAVLAAGGGRDQATRVLATALAEVADCASVPEGAGFTDKLNRAAYTLGGLVAAGYLAEESAEHALLDAAAYARPGQERRSAPIVRSGLVAGFRRPLQLGSRS
ncbi:bifunctional DNA primase/polymerase [Streptomyces melanogenes]|uniref:bifunctional DNA primase/polymerase n=1 Tax=Streptomyces melanogenes TaxID=67326 RepID=UPI00167EADC3|nr:bifunctional DNA primase/polymerase [Streptomyces melanogenes]GGP89425.1 hypothetical protein GCM10010278_79880 [Streptomyces melanogenes]